MQLEALEIFITKNQPPGHGGKYFIFVKLTTRCGLIGYGEVYASSIHPAAMAVVIKDVFQRHMRYENPCNVELMFRRVYSSGFSQRPDPTIIGAFSGLEIACWDIIGKSLNQPICNLLGGKVRASLRSYTYLYPKEKQLDTEFYRSPALSAEAAEEAINKGFTAIKFDPAGPYTIFDGHQPSLADLDLSEQFCETIRSKIGNRADLLFGTHGQFTPSGAIRLSQRLEKYDPLWFEEPIPPDSPRNMELVSKNTNIPIATGERLTTKYEFAEVLRSGAASILQPALGRVGGIWEAKKVAAIAEVFGAQIAPHLYAGPIEWAANIQLSLTLPNFLLLESIGTGDGFHSKLLKSPINWENGFVFPTEAPGLGVELDEVVARENPYFDDDLHLSMSKDEHLP
jgi:L-alanine-DL-glutamate epimerase-like enolase superfamily enzyme